MMGCGANHHAMSCKVELQAWFGSRCTHSSLHGAIVVGVFFEMAVWFLLADSVALFGVAGQVRYGDDRGLSPVCVSAGVCVLAELCGCLHATGTVISPHAQMHGTGHDLMCDCEVPSGDFDLMQQLVLCWKGYVRGLPPVCSAYWNTTRAWTVLGSCIEPRLCGTAVAISAMLPSQGPTTSWYWWKVIMRWRHGSPSGMV